MENRRILSLAGMFLVAILFAPVFSYAYETSTHEALTKETFKHFELLRGESFSGSIVSLASKGSVNEDDLPRPENHFYDPVNDRGLYTWKYRGHSSPQWATDILVQGNFCTLRLLSFACPKKIKASDKLFTSLSDFSWDRAVYEYVHGDKAYAMRALGHQLHLVQDATVPAHTRNDAHEDEDPYESYTEGKIPEVSLKTTDVQYAESIDATIKRVAGFTNNNFLSKDTIFKKYDLPSRSNISLESMGGEYYFGMSEYGKIVLIRKRKLTTQKDVKEEYFLEDSKDVLSDNWSTLSKIAVANGVAVIDLFLREVEQEKNTGALLAMNKSYYETERIIKALAFERDSKDGFSSLAAADIYELNKKDLDGAIAAAGVYGIHVPTVARVSPIKEEQQNNNPASALLAFESVPDVAVQDLVPDGAGQDIIQEDTFSDIETNEADTVEDVFVPEISTAPSVVPTFEPVQTPGNIQPLSFGGGGVGGGGSSSRGPNTESASEETPTGPAPAPDTTAPEVTLSSTQCADVLSDTCVLTSATDLEMSWSVVADDLDYVTYQDVRTEDVTATDTIGDNETKTYTVIAYDTAGNNTMKTITVHTNTMPVTLNEIAWSGTQAQSGDEWIELYNRTPYPVSLEGWSIHTDTYDVAIPLSGTINAYSHFLIEKKDATDTDEATQSPITDVTADLWISWSTSLDNDGRALTLKDAEGTVIDEISECGFRWCAGVSTGYTMERIRADITDDSINWRTASTYWQSGFDTGGNKIHGTPRAENGAPHIVSGIYADTILTTNGSPYIIEGTVTVPTGTTLTIEPGVVIKFATTTAQLIIQGTLRTEGTSESPIVFTAYTDDTYGGDTNNDASATSPTPGSWHSIQVASGGTFNAEHTTIRYGGRRASGQSHHGMVRVQDGGSIMLSDSTLEHAQEEALWIDAGATTDIQRSTFKNNADASFGYGIYAFAYGSDAFSVANSTFESNGRTGLFVDGDARYTIADNAFLNNASAIEISSFGGTLSNNSGSGNTQNGIVLPSALGVVGESITLTTNPLAFLLTQSTTIPAGAEVRLGAGTIYASLNTQLTVEGTLDADGTTFSTENQTPGLPAQAGSWRGIVVQNGGAFSANGITLEYAGGDVFVASEGAGLVITNALSTATLTNSTIQYNKQTGVRIDDGTLSITDSTIAHHTEARTGEAKGVWARGGTATRTNVTFSDNTIDSDVPSP